MKQRVICLLTLTLVVLAAAAQKSQDFAQKFVTLCKSDTTVRCITVSPKMMEQLAAHQTDAHPDEITEAIGKLKSARIVTASASHYEKAEKLLKKKCPPLQAAGQLPDNRRSARCFLHPTRPGGADRRAHHATAGRRPRPSHHRLSHGRH